MLRVIFMGTAELACASLEALCASEGIEVVAVVSKPDRPKGRDLKLQPTAVKQVALQKNLPVLQPQRARNPEFIEELRAYKPDLMVVAAYGQILPQSILDLPQHGCLNVHTSLLPKYRGAAPIQWAIIDGEPETGVTIMKMDAGLDTGEILAMARTPITPQDNAQILHDRLAHLGAELLVKTIPEYVSGKIHPRKQPAEGTSYARKIEKEDGLLDWTQPAEVLWNRIRGFTPWPGAYTYQLIENKPRLLKIWEVIPERNLGGEAGAIVSADKSGILVGCGSGALRILSLQREGSRRMTAQEFLTGNPLRPGDKFSNLR